MKQPEIRNFDLYLKNLTKLDGLANKLKLHLADEGKPSYWLFKPFWMSLITTPFTLGKSTTWLDKMMFWLVNPLTIVSFGAIGTLSNLPFSNRFLTLISENLSSNVLLAIASIIYLISVGKNFIRQVDIFDETFDINAFKSWFPTLYESLRVFKNTEPFSFQYLESYVDSLSKQDYSLVEDINKRIESLLILNEGLVQKDEESTRIITEFLSDVDFLSTLHEKSLAAFKAVLADNITKDILYLFTDFVLFEKHNDKLHCIARHQVYDIPETLDLNGSHQIALSTIRAASASKEEDYLQADENDDRIEISNKIVSKEHVYVYTYYFPKRKYNELTSSLTKNEAIALLRILVLVYTKEKGGN